MIPDLPPAPPPSPAISHVQRENGRILSHLQELTDTWRASARKRGVHEDRINDLFSVFCHVKRMENRVSINWRREWIMFIETLMRNEYEFYSKPIDID